MMLIGHCQSVCLSASRIVKYIKRRKAIKLFVNRYFLRTFYYATDRGTRTACACSKPWNAEIAWRLLRHRPTLVSMITVLSAVVSLLSFRLRGRASLELELVALRHQVAILRRQHPGSRRGRQNGNNEK